MSDNPGRPENPPNEPSSEPAASVPPDPPPATDAESTRAMPESGPRSDGRARRFVGHRATQLVAAGIAGLLIGGGTVALLDRDDDRHFPRDATMRGGSDRGEFGQRVHPRMWEERGEFRDRMRDKLERKIPEHHHGEDGEIIPGPAPTK